MKILSISLGIITLFVVVLVNIFSAQEINEFLEFLPLKCPLKKWTGLLCAFCGMTHAWISIFRGEWAQAFHQNLLAFPLLFLFLFFLVRGIVGSQIFWRIFWWGFICVSVTYTILRNV